MPDIDDPFKSLDATGPRPRPGGGGRGDRDPGTPKVAMAPANVEPIPESARDLLGMGLNPILQAAIPLLLLAGHFRAALSVPDVAGLRRQTLDEIQRFEERAKKSGIHHDVVLAARYALCTALDEAALSTPWGAHSEWGQQTLLVALHREAWGGEKFFELLEGTMRDPSRHIDLMELQYVCLALGFVGKYHNDQARLAQVQQALYRSIRDQRGAPDTDLSPRWRGREDRRNPVIRYVPWWMAGAAALAGLAMAFAGFYTALGRAASPLQAQVAKIGMEQFSGPAEPVTRPGPTLKQLLAPDEASGALSVEEQDGRTLITLLAPDLFASGSATANQAYDPLLRRLASVLAQVPGRVLVVGHTDDQPVRSLRYADNYALSRERAVTVANILQSGNPARVESTGVGASEPRYRPETDNQNRARNRRVEIIHVQG